MFKRLLKTIGKTFEEADVRYMIIGGQAVLLYGEPRLTKDIDVTMGVTLDRLPKIVDLVAQMGLDPLVDPDSFTETRRA